MSESGRPVTPNPDPVDFRVNKTDARSPVGRAARRSACRRSFAKCAARPEPDLHESQIHAAASASRSTTGEKSMAGEYVYSIENVTRQQGVKTILDDVTLTFFFGAKIGVIGPNGSGKTTLLRIMAGLDKEYIGEVLRAKSATIGYLAQEPQLDPDRTVQQIVAEGGAAQQAKLDRPLAR